jgi:alpha-ketoglutarate-dependent taurine dioxygenase
MIDTDRYWIFAGRDRYPEGGMRDLKDSTSDREEAIKRLQKIMENPEYHVCSRYDWGEVFDIADFMTVAEGSFAKEYTGTQYMYKCKITENN